MVRMVCLANSWRPGGRCVAGIDLETGEWVRPIPKGGSAIPEDDTHFADHELVPLDVVDVELAPATLETKAPAARASWITIGISAKPTV